MIQRAAFWKVFGGALSGVAAAVTAFTGVYLALRGDSTPVVDPPTPRHVAQDAGPTNGSLYDRTPWLGVELRQGDRPIKLLSRGGSWIQFEAELAPGPFEITVTRDADDPSVGILAWHDDSIFACVQGEEFHIPGTGIAGAQFALPILYLDQEGFNYYDADRLNRVADGKYSIFISTIGARDLEFPIARFAGPLYLVIFRVPDGFERVVSRNDFELVTLRRE